MTFGTIIIALSKMDKKMDKSAMQNGYVATALLASHLFSFFIK